MSRGVISSAAFDVLASWANVGVAPTCDNWNVTYTLTSSGGGTMCKGTSVGKLRTLLPDDGAVSIHDALTLPASVPAGKYGLAVTVTDPAGYYKPIKLALGGAQADGSYAPGAITVGASGPPLVTPPGPPDGAVAERIRAGATASFTDSTGKVWAADADYSAGGGGTYSVTAPIAGTTDAPLYQSERWGMDAYDVPVPNGTYKVRLHFAEINPSSGARVFDVTAEGQPWADQLRHRGEGRHLRRGCRGEGGDGGGRFLEPRVQRRDQHRQALRARGSLELTTR